MQAQRLPVWKSRFKQQGTAGWAKCSSKQCANGKKPIVCPDCGNQHVRLEGTVSRTVLTQFGKVCLARQRMRCQQCFQRFQPSAPLWQELHLGRVTSGLAEAAALAGVSWPYRQAAQTLTRLSGACISAEEIRLLTNRSGSAQAKREEHACQKQEEQTKREEAADQKQKLLAEEVPSQAISSPSADRTIIGLDGGWIPCRSQRGGMIVSALCKRLYLLTYV